MRTRIYATLLTVCVMALPGAATAQSNSGDVTFTIPVNLTQVSADIVKVEISCGITSDAITVGRTQIKGGGEGQGPGRVYKAQEFPIVGGRLVTTATLVVLVAGNLDSPVGKTASYTCTLKGFSNGLQDWDFFSATHTNAAFRLSPSPTRLNGNFPW